MPPGARFVGRGTVFGNPFPVEHYWTGKVTLAGARRLAVWAFKTWLQGAPGAPASLNERRRILLEQLPGLRGRALACWCPLDQPCHADALIELLEEAPKVRFELVDKNGVHTLTGPGVPIKFEKEQNDPVNLNTK